MKLNLALVDISLNPLFGPEVEGSIDYEESTNYDYSKVVVVSEVFDFIKVIKVIEQIMLIVEIGIVNCLFLVPLKGLIKHFLLH